MGKLKDIQSITIKTIWRQNERKGGLEIKIKTDVTTKKTKRRRLKVSGTPVR